MKRGVGTAGGLAGAGAGVGAAAVATAASACCVGPVAAPLVVSLLGAGGAAWASGLEPYSPHLLAGSGALLGFSFWSLHRPARSCPAPEGGGGTRPARLHRLARVISWAAVLLWMAAVAINVAVP